MPDLRSRSGPGESLSRSASLPSSEAFTVHVIENMQVVSLRHLPGGTEAVERVLAVHHLTRLPKPGTVHGTDPWFVWAGPTEILLLTSIEAIAKDVLHALEPGNDNLACAVDSSAGWVVFDLLGPGIDHVLCRLLDASAIPMQAPHAMRARFMDVCAVVGRLGPERALVAVDRSCASYVATWMSHPWQADASQGQVDLQMGPF